MLVLGFVLVRTLLVTPSPGQRLKLDIPTLLSQVGHLVAWRRREDSRFGEGKVWPGTYKQLGILIS